MQVLERGLSVPKIFVFGVGTLKFVEGIAFKTVH